MIKINKYGMRQHRKLGIDREKLYNSAPSKSGFSFRKKGSTKKASSISCLFVLACCRCFLTSSTHALLACSLTCLLNPA